MYKSILGTIKLLNDLKIAFCFVIIWQSINDFNKMHVILTLELKVQGLESNLVQQLRPPKLV